MLPISLRPDGRRAVIVGGGSVASRKAESLAAAGFPIFVVAPRIDARTRELIARNGGDAAERAYDSSDVAGAALIVAATNRDEINARVVGDARAAGVLVCDASDGERGDFIMPAVARAGSVTIAIATGGTAPAFSKRIAAEVAQRFGPEYSRAAETLAHMRVYAKTVLAADERRAVLQALAELPIAELASMNPVRAEHEVEAMVERLRATPASVTTTVTCATRGSALAMTQTRAVAARLAERGIATTILTVTTTGDRDRSQPIERLGVNVFVKELEVALREGRADYAVHSCKDLPSELPSDMAIAAVSSREDARDAFCSERFERFAALPAGAIVGTSSPRRRCALAALRPDLEYREMRGNVDTRLRKLRDGEYDAIVLAMAGLRRLNARARYTVPFSVEELIPAVGQGALAIETRAADERIAGELRAAVNDPITELCVACERAALRAMRAGCSAPVGVYATLAEGVMNVAGFFADGDSRVRRARTEAPVATLAQAEALGAAVAARLARPLAGRMIVLPRTKSRPSRIAGALREMGAEVVELRAGDAGPDPAERIPDMLLFPSTGAVAAAGPYLERLRSGVARPLVAAMGPASGAAAREAGFEPDAVADEASIEAVVALAHARLEARS
ncbi:MAG TPA: hydroxymethylbilane synthase [Candidatus Baltobacteraceae bacterium]|nr:hydroxymethylbilane synthase [Candidatus Baltobacteraceae bacterium]